MNKQKYPESVTKTQIPTRPNLNPFSQPLSESEGGIRTVVLPRKEREKHA